MPISDTVIEYADKFKKALIARELQSEQRLIAAYTDIYKAVYDKIQLLIEQIGNGSPSQAQVRRLQSYGRLLDDIDTRLSEYSSYTKIEMTNAAKAAVSMGSTEALVLIGASVGSSTIVRNLNRLYPDAIETLLGFLDPQGALYKRLYALPAFTKDQVAQAILNGVGLGQNPKTIAKNITNAFGMALTDSMRMMRTAQLYAYREASRASYVANSNIVKGWQWYATLDGLTCMSCIAMHGTIHPVDEKLNDHHNGRCAALPISVLSPNGYIEKDAGEKWFNGLTEAEQRKAMGKGRFEAWQANQFNLKDMSVLRYDEVYGDMRVEAPLWQLLGAEPPVRIK